MKFALAFVASFFFVGLKSWQQLNVVHKKYLWIMPTSVLMAFCELFTIGVTALTVVQYGIGWTAAAMALCIGVGSGAGSTCATWLHSHILERVK